MLKIYAGLARPGGFSRRRRVTNLRAEYSFVRAGPLPQSCLTVKVCVAIVIVAVRGAPVAFASTVI
jgi:hypothetical protein